MNNNVKLSTTMAKTSKTLLHQVAKELHEANTSSNKSSIESGERQWAPSDKSRYQALMERLRERNLTDVKVFESLENAGYKGQILGADTTMDVPHMTVGANDQFNVTEWTKGHNKIYYYQKSGTVSQPKTQAYEPYHRKAEFGHSDDFWEHATPNKLLKKHHQAIGTLIHVNQKKTTRIQTNNKAIPKEILDNFQEHHDHIHSMAQASVDVVPKSPSWLSRIGRWVASTAGIRLMAQGRAWCVRLYLSWTMTAGRPVSLKAGNQTPGVLTNILPNRDQTRKVSEVMHVVGGVISFLNPLVGGIIHTLGSLGKSTTRYRRKNNLISINNNVNKMRAKYIKNQQHVTGAVAGFSGYKRQGHAGFWYGQLLWISGLSMGGIAMTFSEKLGAFLGAVSSGFMHVAKYVIPGASMVVTGLTVYADERNAYFLNHQYRDMDYKEMLFLMKGDSHESYELAKTLLLTVGENASSVMQEALHQVLIEEQFGNTKTQHKLLPAPLKCWIMTHLDLIITALNEGADASKIKTVVANDLSKFNLKPRAGVAYAFSFRKIFRWVPFLSTKFSHPTMDDELIEYKNDKRPAEDISLASWQMQRPLDFYNKVFEFNSQLKIPELDADRPHYGIISDQWDYYERERVTLFLNRLNRLQDHPVGAKECGLPRPITLTAIRDATYKLDEYKSAGHTNIKTSNYRYLASPWDDDVLVTHWRQKVNA
jgi:hypothetical protein